MKIDMTERCEELVVALSEGTMKQRLQAAEEVCALAKMDAEARARFGGRGAISALVGLLHVALYKGDTRAQEVVTLSLLSITLHNDKNKAAVVAAGAVPHFIKLLEQAQTNENDISQLEEFTQAMVEASGEDEASGCEGLRGPNSNVEQQLKEMNYEKQLLEEALTRVDKEIRRLFGEGQQKFQGFEAAVLMDTIYKARKEAAMRAAVFALLSLSDLEENKACIGSSGAIPLLLSQLLTIRSKSVYEGVLLTLMNLAITTPLNGLLMVRAGGILILMHGLMGKKDVLEHILSLLLLLARIEVGRFVIAETPNVIANLVGILETSSEKEKELVVATLYLLCINSLPHRRLVQNAPAFGALKDICKGGMNTLLAKRQAQDLLELFASDRRNQKRKTTSPVG